jgi:hypothetical protein
MRTLLVVLAAFFAGLWLNERSHRRAADAKLAAVPVPKPEDRRPVSELIPALKADMDMFDTKHSMRQHFSDIIWQAEEVELTRKQFHDLGSDLIAVAGTLADWEHSQELKEKYRDLPNRSDYP